MTEPGIMAILKFYGIIAGGVVALYRFFTYLEKRESEKSVGITKIKELIEADTKVQIDIKDLQHKNTQQDQNIDRLEGHYKDLIQNVWKFIGNK